MIAPCSVKTYGRYLRCFPLPTFKVAFCDLKAAASSAVQLEHEVFRRALPVASDLLVQPLGSGAVQSCQIAVQHDLMAPDRQDQGRNLIDEHDLRVACHFHSPAVANCDRFLTNAVIDVRSPPPCCGSKTTSRLYRCPSAFSILSAHSKTSIFLQESLNAEVAFAFPQMLQCRCGLGRQLSADMPWLEDRCFKPKIRKDL